MGALAGRLNIYELDGKVPHAFGIINALDDMPLRQQVSARVYGNWRFGSMPLMFAMALKE